MSEITVYSEAEFRQAFQDGYDRIVLDGPSGWWKLPKEAADYGFDWRDPEGRMAMHRIGS